MAIYFAQIIAIAIAGAALHPRSSVQGRKYFLWFSFLVLTIISGFRSTSVGVDTASYVLMYKNISLLNFGVTRYEPGFLYYLKFLHLISGNETFFLFINSTICVGITCVFIYYYSESPCLSILLYILLKSYFFQMTGVRQSMATSFVLAAFFLLLRSRNIKTYIGAGLLIALAISFHTIAFVALVPFIIWIWPKRAVIDNLTPKSALRWSIILSAFAFIFYPYIMRVVTLLAPQYTRYFTGTWSDANYSASLFKLLIQLAFLITGVIFMKNKKNLADSDRLSMLMIICTIIVGALAMRMEIWGRLSGIFSVYTPMIWAPSFTSVNTDKRTRIILKLSIIAFSFAYMLVTFIYRPEWDGVVPYSFI